MNVIVSRSLAFFAVAVSAGLIAVPAAVAHESRQVGEYDLLVGWMDEPAYEGMKNGVDFRVTRASDHNGHGHNDNGDDAGVEGLEESVDVEITHEPSGTSEVFSLHAVWGQPGHYTTDVLPTRPGAYEFRFFGTIGDVELDETFVSDSLGGGFDDVVSAADIHFPERRPEIREIEEVARGALSSSQAAEAAAGDARDRIAGANTIAIVALVIAIISAIGTAFFGFRKR